MKGWNTDRSHCGHVTELGKGVGEVAGAWDGALMMQHLKWGPNILQETGWVPVTQWMNESLRPARGIDVAAPIRKVWPVKPVELMLCCVKACFTRPIKPWKGDLSPKRKSGPCKPCCMIYPRIAATGHTAQPDHPRWIDTPALKGSVLEWLKWIVTIVGLSWESM